MPPDLGNIRHVALDLDGTIYSGSTLFPTTKPFLAALKDLAIEYTFLTNNSSKSVGDYVAHLQRFGIDADPSFIYTSTSATVDWLRAEKPLLRRLHVLGTRSLRLELEQAGFQCLGPGTADEPDAVLVGFDTELTFEKLCGAAYWIKQGKPFIATHPDRVCPTDQPTVLVDCGAVCEALRSATGRLPDAVPGKPSPSMLQGIARRNHLTPANLAMVGDRLYTDMAMARATGALGVLVLTGETSRAQAAEHSPQPDLIVSGLDEFARLLQEARLATEEA